MFTDVIVPCIILATSRSGPPECSAITQIWALESQHVVHRGHLQPLSTLLRLSDKGFGSPALNWVCPLLKASICSIKFTWLGLAIWPQPSFLVFCAPTSPFHVPSFQSACSGHCPVLLPPYTCLTTPGEIF